MQQFTYTVRDQSGQEKKGTVESTSREQASSVLHSKGYVVIKIAPKSKALQVPFIGGVNLGHVATFTRQLSTMITSGLPLTDSLIVLERQTSHERFRLIIKEIADDVQGGKSFADSLAKHSSAFSAAYINIVKAGEASGTLDSVLTKLADTLEKDREFQSKIKGAFIYPAIIIIAMTAVSFLIMVFVIPRLADVYTEIGLALPLPTVILITISRFMAAFWWLIIIALAAAFVFLRRYKKTPQGALIMDRLMLKVPVMGQLSRDSSLTELTRTLGALVGAGVPILEALKISSEVALNAVHTQAIKRAAALVEKGAPLSKAIAQEEDFPPIVTQMLAVGEETGKMDDVLDKVSHFYELEVEHQVRNLTTALEPIVMIMLGIMVAFLVISIIFPIYNITKGFQ
ncbi:MAG: hypothetical protein A2864_01965 [Candidatus Woykebacteria bacterium RIFCSPHIGHO2_01_FULL_39_12]|uniref:Type II secretion system protein GspF domain-containing protein n=1 Tax=Candidatus Woykebacteria bacterium RIFCSPHIGHO2_01_FULL_39_12 TaxID=1802599 RepID=A0A1G1WIT8_9BACT|nr:MAG: hypothetical protein A2864_01965 [Candidatus Woykebacteria bacterium RIFCSPHIGHO2_01_FULL_39_12]